MAIRWYDSFDNLPLGNNISAHLTRRYSSAANNIGCQNGGRNNTRRIHGNTSATLALITPPLPVHSKWIVQLAFFPDRTSWWTKKHPLICVRDGDSDQVEFRITDEQKCRVTRNGTLLQEHPTFLYHLNAWNYVQFEAVIGNPGSWAITVNKALILSGLGNTQDTANPSADRVAIYLNVGLAVDDLLIMDGSGPAPYNTVIPDCRVICCWPDAQGAAADWTPSAGTAVECVDDAPGPDDDSTYISAAAIGARHSFRFGLPADMPGQIHSVRRVIMHRKDDAGEREIGMYCGGEASPNIPQSDSYLNAIQQLDLDPSTGLAWTREGLAATDFGTEVRS